MVSTYVDCLTCDCLIRAREPSCPFCGASQRHAPARLSLGLVLGLGLAAVSCTGENGDTSSTIAETSADAVTYAGPDSWSTTDVSAGPGGSTTINDVTTHDADAVTYAGPDETTEVGDASTTSGTSGSSSTATETGCAPITDDATAIGTDCMADLDCPDGYTCQPFQGFDLQMQCQVLCEQTCECPVGFTCTETVDKTGVSWFQCN